MIWLHLETSTSTSPRKAPTKHRRCTALYFPAFSISESSNNCSTYPTCQVPPKDSPKTADCSLRLVGLNGSESLVSMVLEGALACQLNSKTSTRNAVFSAFGATRTPPDSPTSACTRCSIAVRRVPALSLTIMVISSVIAERVC